MYEQISDFTLVNGDLDKIDLSLSLMPTRSNQSILAGKDIAVIMDRFGILNAIGSLQTISRSAPSGQTWPPSGAAKLAFTQSVSNAWVSNAGVYLSMLPGSTIALKILNPRTSRLATDWHDNSTGVTSSPSPADVFTGLFGGGENNPYVASAGFVDISSHAADTIPVKQPVLDSLANANKATRVLVKSPFAITGTNTSTVESSDGSATPATASVLWRMDEHSGWVIGPYGEVTDVWYWERNEFKNMESGRTFYLSGLPPGSSVSAHIVGWFLMTKSLALDGQPWQHAEIYRALSFGVLTREADSNGVVSFAENEFTDGMDSYLKGFFVNDLQPYSLTTHSANPNRTDGASNLAEFINHALYFVVDLPT